jgi:hypothetical protein
MDYQKYFRKIVSLPLAMLFIMLVSVMLTPASTVVQAEGPDALPAPPPVTDSRFGLIQAYDGYDPQNNPEYDQAGNLSNVANAAGVGWTRAILEWHQIQPKTVNDWNYGYLGSQALKWKQELGQNVPMAGLLISTPSWASRGTNQDGLASTVPDGIYEPYNSPENLWGQFVHKAMQEYEGYINEWIIWNEPDTWNSPNCKKGSWNGNVEEYIQLLKVAHQAKQELNQDAKIVMAATTYWHDVRQVPFCARGEFAYLSQMLDIIDDDPEAKANDGFFDAVGINLYLDPDQMYKIIQGYKSKLNEFGYYDKELWLTETNVQYLTEDNRIRNVPGGYPPYHVTLEEQGHFLVQGWSMALAAGADRIELYRTKDMDYDGNGQPDDDEGRPFGLQRLDGSLRPVFWSYRTIATYLGGYESVEGGGYLDVNLTQPMTTLVEPREQGIRRVVVNRGDQGWTTVVWNRTTTTQQVSVPAMGNSGTALLADSFGPIGTINAVNGSYTLSLPKRDETDDRSGGTAYFLVEGPGADVVIERPSSYTDATGQSYPLNIEDPNPNTVTLFPVNASPAGEPAPEVSAVEESEPEAPEAEPEPEPESLIPEGLDCSIEGASYYVIPIDTAPDLVRLDTEHPDLNLRYRGYEEVQGALGLVDYGGDADPEAPQLAGLFADGRIPAFTSLYQVYDWNWEEYSPGGLLNDPWRPISLAGMETRPGEQIRVPDRQAGAIYQGHFKAVVIYASENQITLKYTRDDDVVDGYTIHIENVCVDPVLLEMYRRENAAYRTSLPALEGRQAFGVATGREILVAIRDKGNFMDPRSRKDWWRENAVTSSNFSAMAPQAEQAPQISTVDSVTSAPAPAPVAAPAEVAPQVSTVNSVISPQKVVSRSRSILYQFK